MENNEPLRAEMKQGAVFVVGELNFPSNLFSRNVFYLCAIFYKLYSLSVNKLSLAVICKAFVFLVFFNDPTKTNSNIYAFVLSSYFN